MKKNLLEPPYLHADQFRLNNGSSFSVRLLPWLSSSFGGSCLGFGVGLGLWNLLGLLLAWGFNLHRFDGGFRPSSLLHFYDSWRIGVGAKKNRYVITFQSRYVLRKVPPNWQIRKIIL